MRTQVVEFATHFFDGTPVASHEASIAVGARERTMNSCKISLIAAALGVAALASSPAWADMEITINGVGGAALCGVGGSCYSNSDGYVNYTGTVGNFNINNISISGYQSFGGNGLLMDDADLNISTLGSGSLTIVLSQNNLTGGQILDFLASFSSTQYTNVTATRSFFIDANNTLNAETTFLGQVTNGNYAQFMTPEDLRLNAHYSLTEEIDVTATGVGGTLSSDDDVRVPEPATLGLLGTGLVAFGAFRRRRKAARKA